MVIIQNEGGGVIPDLAHMERLESGRRCLAAALEYAKLGWSVIPLCNPWHISLRGHANGKNACKSPGRSPIVPWKHLQHRPATEEEIREWWRRMPLSNVGVILGEVSGIIGIDIDSKESLERLRERVKGDLPPTVEFTTPSGGYRYLYRIPKGFKCRTTVAERSHQGIRFLGNGSFTVMPPSMGWSRH